MTWGDELAAWWVGEVAGDPAYAEEVIPLALDLIEAAPGQVWLDLGCGEGQMMRALRDNDVSVIGCDVSPTLAGRAAEAGPAVIARLPDLEWLADDAVDGALAVLVLEHLDEVDPLFESCARVVRPKGTLALVINHPAMTAPGSAPVFDPEDGEITWRWGDYFGGGSTEELADGRSVTFHHRSMGDLLSGAAAAGWSASRVVEQPVGEGQAERDSLLALQRNIPRLLGVRWVRNG